MVVHHEELWRLGYKRTVLIDEIYVLNIVRVVEGGSVPEGVSRRECPEGTRSVLYFLVYLWIMMV